MAFTKLKLTTFGQTIETKRHQGKGIHFTRVAIGDGLLGNGSMINRTELVNERHSMLIDGILTTDDAKQCAVVVTLDNSQLEEGFLYRELALMAQDPDTQEEGVYLYDNAGQECEYLDTQDGGVVIYERLKLLIRVEQTEQITFVASGNPLYLSAEDVQEMIRQHNESEDAHPDKADLGEDGKVLPEQLPEMDVSTAMAGFDTKDALADADGIVITDSAAENAGKRVLWSKVKELLGKLYVPLTRTINKKALSSDITLSAADVGAAAASHTHALDALTGILPVNKGGTGQSSLEALLAALKQAGAVQIATGSYVGTGTYGADHPCSLTFDFLPKLIFVFAYYENPDPGGSSARYIPLGNGIENHDEDACLCVLDTSKIGTDYTAGFGLGYIHSANSLWAKKSPDGKTISWYNTYNSRLGPEMYQFNTSGWEFFFGAIG